MTGNRSIPSFTENHHYYSSGNTVNLIFFKETLLNFA